MHRQKKILMSRLNGKIVTISAMLVCLDTSCNTAKTDAENGQNKRHLEKVQATENGEKVSEVVAEHRRTLKIMCRSNAGAATADYDDVDTCGESSIQLSNNCTKQKHMRSIGCGKEVDYSRKANGTLEVLTITHCINLHLTFDIHRW